MRLTTLLIGKKVPDATVPMSLLALHPNVQFNFYRPAVASCSVEMH
jgi:glucosamine-6-phosphate deaminase